MNDSGLESPTKAGGAGEGTEAPSLVTSCPDLRFEVAFFKSERDNSPRTVEMPWGDLRDTLSRFDTRPEKSGPCWSPTKYAPGAKRGNAGVEMITVGVFDVDDGTDPEVIRGRLNSAGYAYLIHSTFSSTDEKPKYRVVVPLAASVPSADWPDVFQRLCILVTDGHTDPATRDPARIYYLPTARSGVEPFLHVGDGRPIALADLPPSPIEIPSVESPPRVYLDKDSRLPHGEHHRLIVSLSASHAARLGGVTVEKLVEVLKGALAPLLDDLVVHNVEIQEAARSALEKFGKPGATHDREVAASDPRIAEFKRLRLAGTGEKDALALFEKEAPVRDTLRESGLLDEWPIGWTDDEAKNLAKHFTFDDVVNRLARVVDLPREKLVLGILLSAQGHLAFFLRSIGPAIHCIPYSPRFSAGKSRTASALTFLGGGKWFDSATVPFLKAARQEGPVILGIDEGDEAERDSPGVKSFLLESHNWDARHGKYGEPDKKGHRAPETLSFGGPIFVTFRKRPWPTLESRAIVLELERSTKTSISDDGAGDALHRLLLPVRFWLELKCEEGCRDWTADKALTRTHASDFKRKLDSISAGLPVLRQRDKARTLLFIAERLGVDLASEIEEALREEEVDSENSTIIEAIERDSEYINAKQSGSEVQSETLRLRVQKDLRDHREPCDLTRNRFASVLTEMGFSKKKGPSWKRSKNASVILPSLLEDPPQGQHGQHSQQTTALPKNADHADYADAIPEEDLLGVTQGAQTLADRALANARKEGSLPPPDPPPRKGWPPQPKL